MPDPVVMTECPPQAELEKLLHGRCTEARNEALCDHVGACSTCQKRLEQIAGSASELAAQLRECQSEEPPKNSAYWRALSQAEEELRKTIAFPISNEIDLESDTNGELKLDFLQPPDRPNLLGKLGSFDIIRVLGRGGMGVVLHAYDPSLDRDVAIKVIDPRLANNEVARQRFCREARAAAAVTHDNLVAVHQVNEDEPSGLPYLVMQLVQGESLEQRLKRIHKLSVAEVARLGMQAAAGLAAAHANRLIHRDIKPANILLESPADRVKLTDFGLARAAEDVKLTRTGFVAGSPLYMAPEQAKGEEVDSRADLFSLGTVLYEATTGVAPFEAKTPLAVLRRVSDETQMPLSRINSEVPLWLSNAVDRLLAKEPSGRFQSAAEVAEVFAAGLVEMQVLSPLDVPAEVCAGSRTSGTRVRNPICWKAVGCRVMPWAGGAVLGGLLIGLLWLLLGGSDSPAAASNGPEPRVTLPGETGAIWTISFLNDDRLITGSEDGTIKFWNHRSGALLRTLEPRQAGTIWSADISADEHYLVVASDEQNVPFWDLARLRPAGLLFAHPTSVKAAVFSPIGSFLATGDRNSTVRIWDWVNQIPVELKGHRGTVHALAYDAAGTRLASTGSDGTVKVWDVKGINWDRMEGPSRTMEMTEHRGPVYSVAFSPDGTKLASGGWDGTVRIWDAANGTQLHRIEAHEGDVWSVAFGAGGRWVASAGSDAHVKVWDVETGKEVFSYRGPRAFHVVRFAPDGTTLAAGSRDGSVRVWDVSK